MVSAESIAKVWVGGVAEAWGMGIVVAKLNSASCAPWLSLHVVRFWGWYVRSRYDCVAWGKNWLK